MSTAHTETRRGDRHYDNVAADARIDAAHHVSAADAGDAGRIADPSREDAGLDLERIVDPSHDSGAAISTASEQVRVQAAQLAEHLQARQKELDHREARLNAWAAELDRDARAARMWLTERVAEFEERDRSPAPAPARASDAAEQAIRQHAEHLETKRSQLDEVEARLLEERTETERLREQYLTERRAWEEEVAAERERLQAERSRGESEIEEKRRAIQRRGEQLDQSHAVLAQLRDELGRMHRETLEIRLATEELWVQLSGDAPPAALVHSLGRIRSKLADQYRMASTEQQQRRQELEGLRGQLVEQHQVLVRQKVQFDKWAADCREEADQQASRLIARQQELDRLETRLRDQSHQWQAERLGLRQEVRRLRLQLIDQTSAALPI